MYSKALKRGREFPEDFRKVLTYFDVRDIEEMFEFGVMGGILQKTELVIHHQNLEANTELDFELFVVKNKFFEIRIKGN